LIRQGINGVQIWPRGIDKKKFSPRFRNEALRRKLGAGKEPLLLFVGRLVREKDIADLAEAARRLRGKGYRFRLAFGGDGPFRRELQILLPHDYFAGFLQGRELAELYASADLFVFPSTTETFGNVVLEAFASGLPVVAVNQGGSADLVKPRVNGLLARPKEPADFAAHIQTLLDHPGERRRLAQGALDSSGDYDWPRINRRLLAGYQALLDQKAGSPQRAAKKKSPPRTLAHPGHRRYGLGPA
jgi:glycosyltransferase involved in cell wall biosynthesis